MLCVFFFTFIYLFSNNYYPAGHECDDARAESLLENEKKSHERHERAGQRSQRPIRGVKPVVSQRRLFWSSATTELCHLVWSHNTGAKHEHCFSVSSLA